MLTLVSVKAASQLLTTVSAVAQELGSLYDPTLPWTRWIEVASRRVLDYVDPEKCSIHSQWTESLEGSDRQFLLLGRRPILSSPALTLTWQGSAVTDFTVHADSGMLYRDAGFPRLHIVGLGTPWSIEPAPTGEATLEWVAAYEAGYVPAGAPSGVTMPAEIEQACIEVLKAQALRVHRDPSIKSETVGELSVTYADETGEQVAALPATARAILEAWR